MKIRSMLCICAVMIFSACSKKESPREIQIKKSDTTDRVQKVDTGSGSSGEQERPSGVIISKEVKNHVGDSVTIRGFVADVYLSEKVAYLNFEYKFPKNYFSCAIFADKFGNFEDIESFTGKTVEVSGWITTFKNKPQIILTSMDQIKIVK